MQALGQRMQPLSFFTVVAVSLTAGCFDPGPVPGEPSAEGGTVMLDAGGPGSDAGGGLPRPPDADAGPPPPVADAGPPPPVADAGPPPPGAVRVLGFTATPAVVPFLGQSTLSWSSENASSCAIAPDVGAVPVSGDVIVGSGAPGSVTTYTLTCQGPSGPASQVASVETRLVAHTGDFTVRTAADLTSLAGANVVTGDLVIEGASDLTGLDELSGLVRVEGSLLIGRNLALTSLSLPNLERVGQDLSLNDNRALEGVSLPALARIGGRLYASRNPPLPQATVDALVAQVQGREGIGGAVLTYRNDVAGVLATLEQGFRCEFRANRDLVYLGLADEQAYYQSYSTPEVFGVGTYTVSGDSFTLDFPRFFPDTPSAIEVEFDHVVAFESPLFTLCHAIETGENDGVDQETFYRCPEIRRIPGVSWEENRVWLHPHGFAEWLRTRVLIDPSDELTNRQFGVYVIDGGRVHFAFGANFEPPRYLSGTRSPDGSQLLIDELEPERGACLRQ